jgi:alpha-amylase
MPAVCFYFQVHQPFRLRSYRIADVGVARDYFDEALNAEVMRKVASKCYLPACEALERLIERHDGAFRIAYSISGVALDQMERYAPAALEAFQRLARTGAVEFLAETYYHSLAALFDRHEFEAQVRKHVTAIERLFGRRPRVFRNTELIYDDRIGAMVADLGFEGVLTEGADDILQWRSPNFVYRMPGRRTRLLLKNYALSDDIAFRFSNRGWSEHPLTADKFASWVHRVSGNGDVVNLFMDYETFGEHQWHDTGIFDFLHHLPEQLLGHPSWSFRTPSEVIATAEARAELAFGRTVSWADTERDITAWLGNAMQRRALEEIYSLGEAVRRRNDPALLEAWRKLQTSDHFYYMCTKWFSDGDVHAYFSPYESPYEAFINYANVLADLAARLGVGSGSVEPRATPEARP